MLGKIETASVLKRTSQREIEMTHTVLNHRLATLEVKVQGEGNVEVGVSFVYYLGTVTIQI